MNKQCLTCKNTITKRATCSLKDWKNRVKYCSNTCRVEGYKGRKLSEFTRKKMSVSRIGNRSRTGEIYTLEQRKSLSNAMPKGDNHWNWKGGITSLNHLLRNSFEYKVWRKLVFERDDYTCQGCGKRGGNMNADHIKQWAFYPDLRFDVDNGRTLCVSCHRATETFSRRKLEAVT